MKTKDYGLVCTLVCKGQNIKEFTTDGTGQVWFEFLENDKVTDVTNEFFMNKVSVPVQDFLSVQKMVKNIIYGKGNYGYDDRKSYR